MQKKWISKSKIIRIILLSLTMFLLLLIGTLLLYVSDYSRAQEDARASLNSSKVEVTKFEDGVAFGDLESNKGIILYPGGKVEYTAYAPLMEELAVEGIFCVIAEMPFHLAVFQSDAAKGIVKRFPGVQQWSIAGHSLGGAMAAAYVSKHPEQFQGLILLSAYATSDLKDSGLRILSLYGSEDTVLNMDSFQDGRLLLPQGYLEICIEGGNHAQFGDYGLQKGDGLAIIDAKEQRRLTVEAIVDFMKVDE